MRSIYPVRAPLTRVVVLAVLAVASGAVGVASAEPPAASFLWFPGTPLTGEPVSLVSTSTDAASPITSLAWDLAGDGAFQEAGPATSTTFSAPGGHIVQLRVTNAEGVTSVASQTIQVNLPTDPLIEPFPIVRFVATASSTRTKLQLLSVEAPEGVTITIDCRGRGCPVKSVSRVVQSSGVGSVTLSFPRFERRLPPGIVLELQISKDGEIGEYTRLITHRGKLPTRHDGCLVPVGSMPVACPS